jgi:hypothetical protein
MQLVELSNKLKPLTIAVGMLSSSTAFAYSDIDNFSGIKSISNNRTLNYIQDVDNNDNHIWIHRFVFDFHLMNWKEKTMFFSSTKSIIEDDDFKAIVAMGVSAVPYILNEIENTPSTLVWALNFIFEKKITDNQNTTITEACKLWVKELKR